MGYVRTGSVPSIAAGLAVGGLVRDIFIYMSLQLSFKRPQYMFIFQPHDRPINSGLPPDITILPNDQH